MEYSINFNLKVLNQWECVRICYPNGRTEKIDLIDCAIAQLIQKYSRENRQGLKYNEEGMVWINHAYLLEQIPMLRIKKRTLEKRLKKLVDANIIDRSIERRNLHGQRAYYCMSDLYLEIEEFWTEYFAQAEDLDSEEKKRLLESLRPDMPRPRVFIQPKSSSGNRSPNGRFITNDAHIDGTATARFDGSAPPNTADYPSTKQNIKRDNQSTTAETAADEAGFSPTSVEELRQLEKNRTPKALYMYCPNSDCCKKLDEEMKTPLSRTCYSCGTLLHPKWLLFVDEVSQEIESGAFEEFEQEEIV